MVEGHMVVREMVDGGTHGSGAHCGVTYGGGVHVGEAHGRVANENTLHNPVFP